MRLSNKMLGVVARELRLLMWHSIVVLGDCHVQMRGGHFVKVVSIIVRLITSLGHGDVAKNGKAF